MLASLALRLVSPVLTRLQKRADWWPLGIFPVRSHFHIKRLLIHGQNIELKFPPGEFERQQWEFGHLHIDDPYRLAGLPTGLRTVLDVGGNIGLFAILARRWFPEAIIHSYEPNPDLREIILSNTAPFRINIFNEAIGLRNGLVALVQASDTLNVRIETGSGGTIAATALSEAMARIGTVIDLLKLDCEGGEWEILKDAETFQKVRFLVMEYHLNADHAPSLSELIRLLNEMGFIITSLCESDSAPVGLLSAKNMRFEAPEVASQSQPKNP